MSDKSERAYWWSKWVVERIGRWLDKNIGRVLFAVGAGTNTDRLNAQSLQGMAAATKIFANPSMSCSSE